MQFGEPVFVLAIIAMSYLAWIITTAIRAKHGYPVENEWGGRKVHRSNPEADKATKALVSENEQLKATVGRLEERLKVLERIATDPTKKLSDEIEQLR
jgi:hypothetical protein